MVGVASWTTGGADIDRGMPSIEDSLPADFQKALRRASSALRRLELLRLVDANFRW